MSKRVVIGFKVMREKLVSGEKKQTIRERKTDHWLESSKGDEVRGYWKLRTPKTELLFTSPLSEDPFVIKWRDFDDRRKYIIADEFQNLPKLRMLERLVNAGRSFSAESIIGTQSVAQVFNNYSRDYARSLLGGMPNKILMRSGDDETTRFEHDSIACVQTERKIMPWEAASRYSGQDRIVHEHYPVSEEELRNLNEGECVIIKPKSWVKCRLMHYDDATPVIDNVL